MFLGPEQVSTCEVPIVFWKTIFFLSQMIVFFTAWICPQTHQLEIYVTPARKCHNPLSSSISTTRWRYNQGKCILAYNSHILCCTFKNLIFTRSLNCTETRDIGHAHFHLLFFPANSWNVANLLFQTPPRRFHRFPRNFVHSICGLSWQKGIKTILIFETILNLINNNFLSILLKTRSVAYLHIGLSEWYETQVTTSPWATKVLWKNAELTFSNSS